MKKVLSMVLVLAMMLSLVTVASVTSTAAEGATSVGPATGAATPGAITITDGEADINGVTYKAIDNAGYLTTALTTGGNYILATDVALTATLEVANGVVLNGNGYTLTIGASLTVATGATVAFNNLVIYSTVSPIGTAPDCNVSFTDCTKTGDVNGSNNTGGYIGAVSGSTATKYTFTNCINANNVHGEGTMVGGFVGGATATNATITFDRCVNNGTISTTVWGNAGFIGASSMKVEFNNCTNAGDINSANGKEAGGFVGYLVTATAGLTATNCHNTAAVPGSSCKGAFVGYVNQASAVSFTGCTNRGAVTGRDEYASFIGLCNVTNPVLKDCVNAGNDKEPTMAPRLYGAQNTLPEGGKQKVRFVALLETSRYDEIGFVVTSQVNGGTVKEYGERAVNKAYFTLKSGEDVISVDAINADFEEPICKYLCAITFKNVPTDGTVVFTVKPYGVVGGETLYGDALALTYTNGVLAGFAPAAN